MPKKRNIPPSKPSQEQNNDGNIGQSSEKRVRIEAGDDIIRDPSLRKDINEYELGIRDDIRRKYVQMGPCQPMAHDFPQTQFGVN